MSFDVCVCYGPEDSALGAEVSAALEADGLRSVWDLAERSGTQPLLVWWDEDAPSDFAGSRRPDEAIFYACYLDRAERLPALVARVRELLAA